MYMYAFFSCFDFISIDVLLIQPQNMAPARGNFRPEPNHQTCKNGTGDAYVRKHKTLCSPAQNPDPQGHSGALGKHNFRTYYHSATIPSNIYSCLCEKYTVDIPGTFFSWTTKVEHWKNISMNYDWTHTFRWTVNEHIRNHKKNTLRNTSKRRHFFTVGFKQWLNIYFWN